MDVCRIDHRDLQIGFARQQAGRHRDPASAGADDHHVEPGIGAVGRGLAAVGDSAGDAIEVIAGIAGGAENVGNRHPGGLGQRPQGGTAGAGAAVGQHWSRQLAQRPLEFDCIALADLAGDHRQVAGADPSCAGGGVDFGKARLIGALAVGAIADDRAVAQLGERLDLVWADLRAD